MAMHGLQGAQHFKGLRRQGNQVFTAALGSLGWNAPLRRAQVELLPAGADQLASANKGQRHQLQGQAGERAAGVTLDLAQQLGQLGQFDPGKVDLSPRPQHIAGLHIGNGVAIRQAVCHRVAHDLPAGLQHAPGNVSRASLFDALGQPHKGRGGQLVDGLLSKGREGVSLKPGDHIGRMPLCLVRSPVLPPGPRHLLECQIGGCLAGALGILPCLARISARVEQRPRFISQPSGVFQGHAGIGPQGKALFFARNPVFPAP